jgi:hypothetical protein
MARITVLGRSGTGKSYYTGYLLEQSVPDFDLAVHMDIEDEEGGLSDQDNEHDPLYLTLTVDKDTANALDWVRVLWNHRKVRVVPDDLTHDEIREMFAAICRAVMRLCKDIRPELTAFISCDEAHNILKEHDFPEAVERAITGGRKHGVETLFCSQRPALLPTTLISQADKRVYFALSDDNDIKKVNKTASFPGDKLAKLPARKAIVENKATGQWEELETDGIGRKRPHFSGDDGIADRHFPV